MRELSTSAPPDTDRASVFRQTLGHFPSGVTVVTGWVDGTPLGMSVSSFCSLSLEPAQVLFCPAKRSATWSRIAATGHFCVNVLSAAQHGLSRRFALPGADRFAGVEWRAGIRGTPILCGALAWIECSIAEVFDGGDHGIVIGDVVDLSHADGMAPLVYFRGDYVDADALADAIGRWGG